MSVTIEEGSINSEIQSKLPNEDEIMEYYQAEKIDNTHKKEYKRYISEKYGHNMADQVSDITDDLGGSNVVATELRSQYGIMLRKISVSTGKVVDAVEHELNNRVEETVNISSMLDLKHFASQSQDNKKAIKQSFVSALKKAEGNRVTSAIKFALESIAYTILKTVQAITSMFMLTVIAWPVIISGYPVKGTAVIVGAIIGLRVSIDIERKFWSKV